MNWKILSLFIATCLLTMLVAFASKKSAKSDFEAAKEVIVMRKIAHQILQYVGDSTSRVLPINQLSPDEFQIPFASSFSFKTDSLVRIIDTIIRTNHLPSNYIVNVLECNTSKVVFGYVILDSEQNDIIPCLGRDQISMRYCITIKFQENESDTTKTPYVAGISLFGFGLVLFGIQRYKKGKPIATINESKEGISEKATISIGNYQFHPEEQFLLFNKETIVLTSKESKLLSVFATNPNQILDRNRLQKIWEDDGVIVGRSLDVFISKLRKKLENDPSVKLVNIHGKGYRLEIS